MRKYVIDFLQENIIALRLKPAEVFILSYLVDFFGSGYAKMEFIDNKRHYYITYKKILDDLDFLQIKERRLRYILDNLHTKQVISKKTIRHSEMYIHVNLDLLCEPISQDQHNYIFAPKETPIAITHTPINSFDNSTNSHMASAHLSNHSSSHKLSTTHTQDNISTQSNTLAPISDTYADNTLIPNINIYHFDHSHLPTTLPKHNKIHLTQSPTHTPTHQPKKPRIRITTKNKLHARPPTS